MRPHASILFCLIITIFSVLDSRAQATADIWQETISIPTYQTGEPDPNPRFYDGRTTQGAQGRVYPYAMSDVLLREKADQEYTIVYLENEYVKISVIPELGGRIFTALDKTNNYDYFYRQHVIKPALIGTLGKWISGGSEWNFPHHHKATTMMTMEHQLEKNEDGSVTLWLAETEQRHRFRITLSMTLYPERSYLKMDVIPYNTSPFVHSFLYFANPAVHVDSTYQVIFPHNVEYVTQHAKREFIQWPMANGYYNGKLYEDTDISWWKNLPSPVSFFAWNDEADFFAGYDHGKEAGVTYISNHHTAPGMKFFTFGCGESGAAWDKRLTDTDGPYLELMAGVYSDNQPDYSWAQPFERKNATQYWYPVRELGGMDYANLNGAFYLDKSQLPKVEIRLNTTRPQKNAKVVVSSKEGFIWEFSMDIGPDQPYTASIEYPDFVDMDQLKVSLFDQEGNKLMAYQYKPRSDSDMPQEVVPPGPPDEIETIEELFFTGMRLNQFYNANMDPMPYYEEALKRDPGNYLVNTQLGVLACKGFRWTEAEDYLRLALDRITYNHTRPKNGEAWYYLGISLRGQGKMKEAYDAFYRASWDLAWHSASYYQLAQLDCLNGEFETSLDHVNRSISTNQENLKAQNLKVYVLNRLGKEKSAQGLLKQISMMDPLDVVARYELDLLETTDVQVVLELATFYGNSGAWEKAIAALELLDKSKVKSGTNFPMLYYYLSYYHAMAGNTQLENLYAGLANKMPIDYCFPYRWESLEVLEYILEQHPEDARAHYYIGNLLFDHQPERAVEAWETALSLDDTNAVLQRNLGFAYAKVSADYPTAISHYEKALELKKDARIIYELDILYEKANSDLKKREVLFSQNKSVTKERVDALTRQVLVNIQSQKYDQAINLLDDNYFYRWEGGNEVREYYEDAHLLRGINLLSSGKKKRAMADFQAALAFPENLEEGRPEFHRRFARSYFYNGLVYEQMGDMEMANKFYRKAADERTGSSEFLYYNILACNKLGEKDQATQHIKKLDRFIRKGSEDVFFAKFSEKQSASMRKAQQHYLSALLLLASSDEPAAEKELKLAMELNPYHSWARAHYQEIAK